MKRNEQMADWDARSWLERRSCLVCSASFAQDATAAAAAAGGERQETGTTGTSSRTTR